MAYNILAVNTANGQMNYQGTVDFNLNYSTSAGTAAGVVATVTYADSVTFGQVVYVGSDGNYHLAKADVSTTVPAVGMSLGTYGPSESGLILFNGIANNSGWTLTSGNRLWVSDATAGLVTATQPTASGHFIQSVGIATGTNTMYFNPVPTLIQHV